MDDLMDKVRACGVPLAGFTGAKPYRGVLASLNEAFLIDKPTRGRLMREDPRSAEIVKPYLRGQDIKRWSPEWRGLWMIFARRGIMIDAYPAVRRHLERFRDRLEPKPRSWSGDRWPGRKAGSYKWYEIQDSVDYWEAFEQPKMIWQDLSFYSRFCVESDSYYTNDLCFVLPSNDKWLVAVFNSPLMWSFMWRNVMHGKDEVLRLKNIYTEKLPIALPADEARAEAEGAAARLISLARSGQEARLDTLDWLRVEFGVEKPGGKLEDFAALDADAFVAEVRKRRPKSRGRLTPAALRDLRAGYEGQAVPVREGRAEAATLERRLSNLVNTAYGLTPLEVNLLWSTAPPRMPRL